jgi:hypothetical protein
MTTGFGITGQGGALSVGCLGSYSASGVPCPSSWACKAARRALRSSFSASSSSNVCNRSQSGHLPCLSKDYELLPEVSEAMIYGAMVRLMLSRFAS